MLPVVSEQLKKYFSIAQAVDDLTVLLTKQELHFSFDNFYFYLPLASSKLQNCEFVKSP